MYRNVGCWNCETMFDSSPMKKGATTTTTATVSVFPWHRNLSHTLPTLLFKFVVHQKYGLCDFRMANYRWLLLLAIVWQTIVKHRTSADEESTTPKPVVCESPLDLSALDSSWLETVVIGNFRIWHIMFSVIAVITGISIVFCCLFRCRIPRTKQEIEADFIRKRITSSFRSHLNKIKLEELEFDPENLLGVFKRVEDMEETRVNKHRSFEKRKLTFKQKLKQYFSGKEISFDEETVDRGDGESKGDGKRMTPEEMAKVEKEVEDAKIDSTAFNVISDQIAILSYFGSEKDRKKRKKELKKAEKARQKEQKEREKQEKKKQKEETKTSGKSKLVELKPESLEKDTKEDEKPEQPNGEVATAEKEVTKSETVEESLTEVIQVPTIMEKQMTVRPKFSFRDTVQNLMTRSGLLKAKKPVIEDKEVVHEAIVINIELVSKQSSKTGEDDDGEVDEVDDHPSIPIIEEPPSPVVEKKDRKSRKSKHEKTVDTNLLRIPPPTLKVSDSDGSKKMKKKEKKSKRDKSKVADEPKQEEIKEEILIKEPEVPVEVVKVKKPKDSKESKKESKKSKKEKEKKSTKASEKDKRRAKISEVNEEEPAKKPIKTEIQIIMKEKSDKSASIEQEIVELKLEEAKKKLKEKVAKQSKKEVKIVDLRDKEESIEKSEVKRKSKEKKKKEKQRLKEEKRKSSEATATAEEEKKLRLQRRIVEEWKEIAMRPESSKEERRVAKNKLEELAKVEKKLFKESKQPEQSKSSVIKDFFKKKKPPELAKDSSTEQSTDSIKARSKRATVDDVKPIRKEIKTESFDRMVTDLNQELKQKLEARKQLKRSKTIDESYMRTIDTIGEEGDISIPNREEFKKRLSEVLLRRMSTEQKRVHIHEPPVTASLDRRPKKKPKPVVIVRQATTSSSEIEIPVHRLQSEQELKPPPQDMHRLTISDVCPLISEPGPSYRSSSVRSLKAQRTNVVEKIVKPLPGGGDQQIKIERTHDVIISVPSELPPTIATKELSKHSKERKDGKKSDKQTEEKSKKSKEERSAKEEKTKEKKDEKKKKK